MKLVWLSLVVFAVTGQAATWHLPGWRARAVVEVTAAGADPAGVKIVCQGRAQPDGRDYRVLDAQGRPVPFRVMWHEATRYSLIMFRAAATTGTVYFLYFDNPQAPTLPADFEPQCGLLYETRERPAGDNPQTFAEMQQLIAGSRAQHGARWQRHISNGYNPFGSSDNFISSYRGWLRVPQAGRYWFCTASNEASFSFLNGKELIHWPGRHTEERGIHGEKNVSVELTAGLHYIEYYHEEVTLTQMAFLGWRSTATGNFVPVDFTAPRPATVTRYESPPGELLTFEPQLVDSIWPADGRAAQYTRVRFRSNVAGPWDFGDGQTATGDTVEHVYLQTGSYQVSCGPARWPLEVYELQHVTAETQAGSLETYRQIAKGYDRTKLTPAALAEWEALLTDAPRKTPAPAFIPPPVRAAKIGAYPDIIRANLAAKKFALAHRVVDEWEELFPTEKERGLSAFWRGKIFAAQGQPAEAVAPLRASIERMTGAAVETEARWLLAESLVKTGQADAARAEWQKLVATGLRDEYTQQARQKLAHP